jgi:hypothetical protein
MVRLRRTPEAPDEADQRASAALAVLHEAMGGPKAGSDDPVMQRLIEEERDDREYWSHRENWHRPTEKYSTPKGPRS